VATALQHVENAGLQAHIHIEKRDIADAAPADSWQPGLVACNPPYGERLGDEAETAALYQRFGQVLKSRFTGWQASLIISNPELGFRLGVRSQKPITFFNGALECKLLRLNLAPEGFFVPKPISADERVAQVIANPAEQQAEMFANRLRKNAKKLDKWAKQQRISCYRLYDADLPEYAVAVDVYHGEQTWVNVQEYESPKTIDQHKANQRLAGIMAEIPSVLGVPPSQVFLKIRRKQKALDQYQKQADTGRFHAVEEGGHVRILARYKLFWEWRWWRRHFHNDLLFLHADDLLGHLANDFTNRGLALADVHQGSFDLACIRRERQRHQPENDH
jgi:23S rRNA (guanine2445-N2)-methyltransferase / 23S rRNA (guanine2069-N7)-methyltransferase